jgi:hypothetical protein
LNRRIDDDVYELLILDKPLSRDRLPGEKLVDELSDLTPPFFPALRERRWQECVDELGDRA